MADYDRWFRRGTLPELCMELRMQANGSADPWSEDDVRGCIEYLRLRLDSWTPSLTRTGERFDAAVKALVTATLDEVAQ